MIFTTLWLFVVFALASLSVDAGNWYYTRMREQKAADAAALAGAAALSYSSATTAIACQAANNAAAKNGFNTAAALPNTSSACSSTGNGVTLTVTPVVATKTASATISQTGKTFFSVTFGLIRAAPVIAAKATAKVAQQTSSNVCVLGLNGQVLIQLLNLTVRNCTFASNATTYNAIQLPMVALSYIQSLYSAGGICMTGVSCQPNVVGELTTGLGLQALLNYVLQSYQIPPKEFQLPIANPFAPLNTMTFSVAPSNPAPVLVPLNVPLVANLNLVATYSPGTYASKVTTNALIVNFNPGTYVFQNGLDIEGPLNSYNNTTVTGALLTTLNSLPVVTALLKTLGISLNPNVSVTGTGVTFVVSQGTLQIGAKTIGVGLSLTTNLSAPAVNNTNAALNGVLFDISSPSTAAINLGSVLSVSLGTLGSEGLLGAVYAPNAPVNFGTASINLALFANPCLIVLGQSVTLPILQAALNLTFNPTACTTDGVQIPHPQFLELTQ